VMTVGALSRRNVKTTQIRDTIDTVVRHGPLRTSRFISYRAWQRKKAFATALIFAAYSPHTRHVRSTMSSYDGVSLAFSDLDLLSTAVDHSENDPTASRTRD